jgi:Tol biopolymer transport system component
MYTRLIKSCILVTTLMLGGIPWISTFSLQAQTTQELFGKNRVQYKRFNWKAISTTNFEIFFYQEGNEAAYQAARYAEADFDRIADLLGYTPYSKTKIFLYNSSSDLQQSNVGISSDDLLSGGQTSFIKSQVEIPFNGNQIIFKRDLSNSISQVFISEMMFGGSLKDMLQSSLLLALPDWFMSGAAAYVSSGWSLEMDDYMRDALLNKNIKKPSALTGEKATIVGQSIWNYIAERYGKSNISNILNLTRIIRNEETSIASTLGIPYSRFMKEWKQYYTDIATETTGSYIVPANSFQVRKKNRKGFIYNQLSLSPDGKYLAYSENRKGVYRIKVINTETQHKKTIFRKGHRAINQKVDKQIPLLSWQSNHSLVFITVEQARNRLYVYDLEKHRIKSKKSFDNFNTILDFDVSDDGSTLALSAGKDGQSDIFLYNLNRNSLKQLTNDLFDDLNPHFLTGSSTDLAFSSNRQNDSILVAPKDFHAIQDDFSLFMYNGSDTTAMLKKLGNLVGNATHPIFANSNVLYFLNDEKGIQNIYRYDLEKKTANQVSNFRQGIRAFDMNYATKSLAYYSISDSREYIGFMKPFNFDQTVNPIYTKRNGAQEEKALQIKATEEIGLNSLPNNTNSTDGVRKSKSTPGQLETGEIDIDNYQFDSDLVISEEKAAPTKNRGNILQSTIKAAKKDNIAISGPFPYKNRFSTNNVVVTPLINPITGLGFQFDMNMNDLLEDHIIKLGGLLNLDFHSNNFYGEYKYLKNRVDFGVRLERKQIYFSSEGRDQKYRLNEVALSASYPFSVSSRFTVSPFYAGTSFNQLPTPFLSTPPLLTPLDASTDYSGVKLEYVFDNTIVNGMNMIEGTRMKVHYDFYNAFNSSNESFDRLTIDIRNYKKIHRDIIFATRLSFGHGGGFAKKKFLLGGMDNWAFNVKNESNNYPLPGIDKTDYYFLSFITNLRGFDYNKLSGYNYGLFNAELRLPLVKYFYRGPITSNFLKNLQFVAFTDIGTAWNEHSPFSRQNDLNTEELVTQSGPFKATVINFKNPFLTGYGFGARTFLLGYYIKFDAAWGVENYVVGPAHLYLTLGYDF